MKQRKNVSIKEKKRKLRSKLLLFNFLYPRLVFVNTVSSSSSCSDDSFSFGWMFHWFCGSLLVWLSISRSTNFEGIILSIAIGADTASLNKLWTKASVCYEWKKMIILNSFASFAIAWDVVLCTNGFFSRSLLNSMLDMSRYMSQPIVPCGLYSVVCFHITYTNIYYKKKWEKAKKICSLFNEIIKQ